jgi:hypothetical protein
MLSRRRIPYLVAFPAVYVGVAAIRAEDTRPSGLLLVALAVIVALLGGRVHEGADPASARARVWTAAGLSVAMATAGLSSRPAWAPLAREIAALLGMLAAVRALTRIEGDIGLSPKATEAAARTGLTTTSVHRLASAALVLAWGTAAVLDGLSTFAAVGAGAREAAPAVASVAGVLAAFVLGGAALLAGAVRGLELTARPKALACTGVAALGLLLALALASSFAMAADAAIALGGAAAASLAVRVAASSDALRLARIGRRVLTLIVFGGPVVALTSMVASGRSAGAALALGVLAVLVGALARHLEEPFLPVRGVLLDALADARDATREREARAAIAHALVCLRDAAAIGLGPTAAPSPELWLLHPTRVMTVNAAGYLQERPAKLPHDVFDVALGEPHATLRTSVLRALEVRRPDLRPLLAWLEQREALFATVIAEGDEPDGLLVVPAGARTIDLTLEEAAAAKALADGFVAVAQAASARVRHLEREHELGARVDALDDENAKLRHALDLETGRHALAAARLARPATVGIYSASSRMAYEALERRIGKEAPTVIVARAGVDPVPYVARAHLAGPRKDGPLVVVDGTSSREHELDRWIDEHTSPLALADRGLLFLVDGAALPRDVQLVIARAIAERRAPWERSNALDVALALSATRPVRDLLEAELAPELAARFEDGDPIVLPGLRARSEDLRSIVADRLAREGLRVRGRPVGLDVGAFARLVEHPFPGEDAELAAVVTRLVASARDDVVHAADVDALGLVAPAEPDVALWPEGARAANRRDDG